MNSQRVANYQDLNAYMTDLDANRMATMESQQLPIRNLFAARSSGPCFNAVMDNGKYKCPICQTVEAGSFRIITHSHDCENNGKRYCQQPTGGKRTAQGR